jgi:hypothetical protein
MAGWEQGALVLAAAGLVIAMVIAITAPWATTEVEIIRTETGMETGATVAS